MLLGGETYRGEPKINLPLIWRWYLSTTMLGVVCVWVYLAIGNNLYIY
jgi:hypothetical protein